jgi:hypothetical protein
MFYSDYLRDLMRKAHIQIELFSNGYLETIDGKYSRTVDYSTVVWC